MQNLQPKTPYKFKKSYGGTPEPLPPEYPPFRRGPSLTKKWLELKSLKGQTKAEELGAPGPELLSLRLPLTAL